MKQASVHPRPSFLDFIRSGLNLNFIVSIDFTASNGDPRNPSSLHYYSQRPTIYEGRGPACCSTCHCRKHAYSEACHLVRDCQEMALCAPGAVADAISAVGGVLEHYDTDQKYPAYGFGAVLPPSAAANHCFPLNGNPSNPEVAGVRGILDAYRHTLSTVRLSGPTLFAPIINAAAQVCAVQAPPLQHHPSGLHSDGDHTCGVPPLIVPPYSAAADCGAAILTARVLCAVDLDRRVNQMSSFAVVHVSSH